MSLTIEKLSEYVIKKPFISYNLNINKKFQQNISDNKFYPGDKNNLFNLVKNIKDISNERKIDNSSISSISSDEQSKNNFTDFNTNNFNIQKIDKKISNILDNKKYFIYVPNKTDSFIGSILSIIDINYCSSSEQSKKKMISDFRKKIGFEIDTNFKILNYKRKINKSNIQDILLNNKYTDNNTHIYISDLLNLNVIIVYGMNEYSLLNTFINGRNNIVLFYDKGIYCSLLNQDNDNFLDINTVNKIKKMYSQKTFFDSVKTKKKTDLVDKININDLVKNKSIEVFGSKKKKLNSEDTYIQVDNKMFIKKNDLDDLKEKHEKKKEIELIKKMKVQELQAVAKKYNIDIYNNKKKKLKKNLIEDIVNHLQENI